MDAERAPSPAVDRTLTVLETLVRADEPLTLTALAKAAGLPLATCAAIAHTLEQRGYAMRKVVGRSHFWRPTLRLYGLAVELVRRVDLPSLAQDDLRALADALSMPAHVGTLEGASIVYVAKAATPGFVQFDTYRGKVAPYHLTALGRAIAAHLPPDDLTPLLANLSPGNGPKATPVDPGSFRALLSAVREQGYALEDEEEQAEIACVAAPFFDAEGTVAGAVGVTGFARDLVGERRTAAIAGVLRVGKAISRRLGHPGP
ncbi:IclR family transcriptional regulator [Nonomuraea sp. NBC_01738]|uniref:IclR family transcriptional regulator n=1 Tax=Nonomuraea sp. NBC_01738 TaxID=2976003 RepID=UPI002E167D68|nr:IclR family transcriptional regulator [Nonomuraea sp. NBC_01738]